MSPEELDGMTYAKLKDLCKSVGLPYSGKKKAMLITLLEEHFAR